MTLEIAFKPGPHGAPGPAGCSGDGALPARRLSLCLGPRSPKQLRRGDCAIVPPSPGPGVGARRPCPSEGGLWPPPRAGPRWGRLAASGSVPRGTLRKTSFSLARRCWGQGGSVPALAAPWTWPPTPHSRVAVLRGHRPPLPSSSSWTPRACVAPAWSQAAPRDGKDEPGARVGSANWGALHTQAPTSPCRHRSPLLGGDGPPQTGP